MCHRCQKSFGELEIQQLAAADNPQPDKPRNPTGIDEYVDIVRKMVSVKNIPLSHSDIDKYLNSCNVKNKVKIYSIGDPGDLTYPYKILPNETKIIKDIVQDNHDLSSKIKNSKKPLIIIGHSVLKLKSGKYVFEEIKKYLTSINKITDEWNSLNVLSKDASTVGSIDLNIISSTDTQNVTLTKTLNNEFEVLFLIGCDKKMIVYDDLEPTEKVKVYNITVIYVVSLTVSIC